jgi:hypothetical protein
LSSVGLEDEETAVVKEQQKQQKRDVKDGRKGRGT